MGLSKITIKQNNTKVSLSAKGESLDELCEKALKVFNGVYNDKQYIKKTNEYRLAKEKPIAPVQDRSTRVNNDRLPNIVNLNDFEMQDAKTESARIRCPHCGQAFCAIACDILMARDIKDEKSDFEFVTSVEDKTKYENIKFDPEKMNILDYYSDIINAINKKTYDVAITKETIITCPVCGSEDNAEKWFQAWDEKEKFFGLNDICDICGGEVEHSIMPNGSHDKCTKCGFEMNTGGTK